MAKKGKKVVKSAKNLKSQVNLKPQDVFNDLDTQIMEQEILQETKENALLKEKKAKKNVKKTEEKLEKKNKKHEENPVPTNKTFDESLTKEKAKKNKYFQELSKIKNSFNKSLFYTIISGILLFLFFVLPIFAGRSLLSRTVGAINKDAGRAVDNVTNIVLGNGGIDFDELKKNINTDKACFSLWDGVKNKKLEFENGKNYNINQFKITTKEGKNVAFLNADYNLERKNKDIFAEGSLNTILDTEKLAYFAVNFRDLGEGTIFAKANILGIFNPQIVAFSPTELKVESKTTKLNEVLNAKNANDYELNGNKMQFYGEKLQKDGSNFYQVMQKLMNNAPADIFNDDTGHALAHMLCSDVKDIEIGALKNYSINVDKMDFNNKNIDVKNHIDTGITKKISFIANDKSLNENYKVASVRYNKLLENIKKDETFKKWLKNNYENFKEIGYIINNTDNSYKKSRNLEPVEAKTALPYFENKEVWEKFVDEKLANLKKNDQIEQIIDNFQVITDLLDFKNHTDLYVDLKGDISVADFKNSLKLQKGASSTIAFALGGGAANPAILEVLDSNIESRVILKNNPKENIARHFKDVQTENIKPITDLENDLKKREEIKNFIEKMKPVWDRFFKPRVTVVQTQTPNGEIQQEFQPE